LEIPWGGYDAWVGWEYLSQFRGYTDAGPQPLKMTDIVSYMWMRDIPKEYGVQFLRMLRAIEAEYIKYILKKQSRR